MRQMAMCALVFVCAFGLGTVTSLESRASGQQDQTSQVNTQEENDRLMREVAARIAGRESEPAEAVFRNIQWLKGVRAGQLLAIMNRGYSAALGVSCQHCHDTGDWAADEKRPKRAAREMAAMHRTINTSLASMTQLASPSTERAINCATCHRGSVSPRTTR